VTDSHLFLFFRTFHSSTRAPTKEGNHSRHQMDDGLESIGINTKLEGIFSSLGKQINSLSEKVSKMENRSRRRNRSPSDESDFNVESEDGVRLSQDSSDTDYSSVRQNNKKRRTSSPELELRDVSMSPDRNSPLRYPIRERSPVPCSNLRPMNPTWFQVPSGWHTYRSPDAYFLHSGSEDFSNVPVVLANINGVQVFKPCRLDRHAEKVI